MEPDYFEFFRNYRHAGTAGRPLTTQDTAHSRHVAVIDEALARKFVKNKDPTGKHFGKTTGSAGDYEIVGVAKDARFANYNLDQPSRPSFFCLKHNRRGTRKRARPPPNFVRTTCLK